MGGRLWGQYHSGICGSRHAVRGPRHQLVHRRWDSRAAYPALVDFAIQRRREWHLNQSGHSERRDAFAERYARARGAGLPNGPPYRASGASAGDYHPKTDRLNVAESEGAVHRGSMVEQVTPSHICTGTGLTPAASAPGVGSPRPHLRREWGPLSSPKPQICARTDYPRLHGLANAYALLPADWIPTRKLETKKSPHAPHFPSLRLPHLSRRTFPHSGPASTISDRFCEPNSRRRRWQG